MRSYVLPELVYPRPSRLGRFGRAIGVIAAAGTVGALIGGVAAFAILGEPASPRTGAVETVKRPTIVALQSAALKPSAPVAPVKALPIPQPQPPVAAVTPPAPKKTLKTLASASAEAPAVAAQPAAKPLYDRADPAEAGGAHRVAEQRARVRRRSRRHFARRPLSILPPDRPAYSEYQDSGWNGGFFGGDGWRN